MQNNKLVESLVESVKEAMDEVSKVEGHDIMKNNYHLLSERGKYVMGVFKYYSGILSIVKDLEKTEVFLRRLPNSKYLKENGISGLQYTQYHLEVFIHKVHTLLEMKKLMINEVYELGIKEKDCNWDLIKVRPEIKGKKIHKILDSYYATFKQIIDARHVNTHRGVFKDSEKDDLESALFLYEGYEKYGLELDNEIKKAFPKFIIDWKIKGYRKGKIKLVKDSKKKIEVYVKNFFDEMTPEFEKRKAGKVMPNLTHLP